MSCITTLSSCFKEEPLNAECDIEQAYIHPGNWLKLWFTNASDTLVNVQIVAVLFVLVDVAHADEASGG